MLSCLAAVATSVGAHICVGWYLTLVSFGYRFSIYWQMTEFCPSFLRILPAWLLFPNLRKSGKLGRALGSFIFLLGDLLVHALPCSFMLQQLFNCLTPATVLCGFLWSKIWALYALSRSVEGDDARSRPRGLKSGVAWSDSAGSSVILSIFAGDWGGVYGIAHLPRWAWLVPYSAEFATVVAFLVLLERRTAAA